MRQRVRRALNRVTSGNGDQSANKGKMPLSKVAFLLEEKNNMTDPRLIKRTTIEETFAAPEEDALAGPVGSHEDGDDDLGEDEDDDDLGDEA